MHADSLRSLGVVMGRIKNKIDSGTAWVLRWFAKPLVTGSIPATVSISKPEAERIGSLGGVLEMMFDPVGGSDAARSHMEAAAYNKGYVAPKPLIWLARQLIWHLRQDRDDWREKAIAAQKEVSMLKRARLEISGKAR